MLGDMIEGLVGRGRLDGLALEGLTGVLSGGLLLDQLLAGRQKRLDLLCDRLLRAPRLQTVAVAEAVLGNSPAVESVGFAVVVERLPDRVGVQERQVEALTMKLVAEARSRGPRCRRRCFRRK